MVQWEFLGISCHDHLIFPQLSLKKKKIKLCCFGNCFKAELILPFLTFTDNGPNSWEWGATQFYHRGYRLLDAALEATDALGRLWIELQRPRL